MAARKKNKDTVVLATRVEPAVVETIRAVAKSETRNLSNMVYVLIREALKARGVQISKEQ